MIKSKIELNILFFILTEAFFLLFFFKTSILNIAIGITISVIINVFIKKIKKSKLIEMFLLIVTPILLVITILKISNFISYNYLRNNLKIIITFSLLFTSFYLTKKGYHSFIKSLETIFYFYFLIRIISIILIIPNVIIDNIDNFQYEIYLSFDIFYIVLAILFIKISINYLTNDKINNTSYLLCFTNCFFTKALCIIILSSSLIKIYEYPYFSLLKRIKYLDFIERMEGLLSFQYLIIFIFFLSYLILLIKELTKIIFN